MGAQLNIKSEDAYRLASRISELTGESLTSVVIRALRDAGMEVDLLPGGPGPLVHPRRGVGGQLVRRLILGNTSILGFLGLLLAGSCGTLASQRVNPGLGLANLPGADSGKSLVGGRLLTQGIELLL